MGFSIDANIEALKDEGSIAVIVTFPTEAVWEILGLTTGLLIHRFKTLVILGSSGKITISLDDLSIRIELQEIQIEKTFTQNMFDSIVCCCFDKAFRTYVSPHIDIDFGDTDLTFQWTE